MNNSKKDSSKSMRYKEGPKRSFRPNEWYLNQKAHSETDKFFSSSKGGVPNNPENANSFRPISAPINPKESMSGDFVKRKNPYGDGEQIAVGEGPTLVRPNQRGSSFLVGYFSVYHFSTQLKQKRPSGSTTTRGRGRAGATAPF